MTTPKTIVLDLDSVLLDLLPAWLGAYNEKYGDNLRPQDITDWDTSKFVVPACGKDIFKILETPGLFEGCLPVPGGPEVAREFHEAGHRVVVVTQCNSWDIAAQKVRWLRRYLPWLGANGVCFLNHKDLVRAEAFVDDGPHNIAVFRRHNPEAFIAMPGYGYNVGTPGADLITALPGARGYTDAHHRRNWAQIQKAVLEALR